MSITTTNPATEQIIKTYELLPVIGFEPTLERAHEAYLNWSRLSITDRAGYLMLIADLLEERKDKLALLITEEMGKPIAQSDAEIQKCVWVCRYYAENAERFLASIQYDTEYSHSYAAMKPLGVILSIMPWNFPFWQLFRFGAPALMAGNAILLKHAPNTMGCAHAIEKLVEDAGLPRNTLTNMVVDNKTVPEIIAHPTVSAVTFTGSTRIGSLIAELAGRNLKKCVLELGGSDPYIVLEDADLEKTVEACLMGRMFNTGQSCIAAKRFIVVDSIAKDFTEAMLEKIKALRMGSPLEAENFIGPIARKDLQYTLETQVRASIDRGAKCLIGGGIPDMTGFYYPPTLLTNIQKDQPAFGEELFGPVALILNAATEQEAIDIANDTCYGLGSAVFTSDTERGLDIAENKIEAGCCFVNDFVKSDPRLPFGGIKNSGFGRELSEFGIREFVNVKTVVGK